MSVNEELIKKYKNDKVLIKTYYQYKDSDNQLNLIKGIVNPLKIDNRQEMSPTDNQTRYPACAGYSACTLIESLYWKQTGKLIQLDSKQVYAKAKELDGEVDMEGTYLETSLNAALQLSDIDFLKNAKIKLFFNDKTIQTIELVKFLIHKYGMIQVGFNIDEGWYDCNEKNFMIKERGLQIGGHAVNLVGYDTTGAYVLNQWGIEWGTKGYAIIPWDLFLKQLMYGAYLTNITY